MVHLETIDRIFDLAAKRFKDQKDFAAALGVSTTMVSAWRRGISQSYERRLSQIAEVLNTTASYLLGEEKKPTADSGGLTEAEQALMDLFRRLTPEQQEGVIRIVQAAADKL